MSILWDKRFVRPNPCFDDDGNVSIMDWSSSRCLSDSECIRESGTGIGFTEGIFGSDEEVV